MKIRVFNADDHPLLKKGITNLILEQEDMEWVGSAGDGKEALEKLRALQPDVAILDIEMPHYSGIEVVKKCIEEGSKTSFIILTLFKDESFLTNALNIGVLGYLLKESSEKEIIDCIHSVYKKQAYVNPQLIHVLLQAKSQKSDLTTLLSSHEINILRLIADHKTSSEIADMLFISPKTVANHRNNISKKLSLSGKQNGLLTWALENKALL